MKIRLKERKIPQDYPNQIVFKPDNLFIDNETNHKIAIKKLLYNNKWRPMVVVYDIIELQVQIITIYPTTEQEINKRINRGRWSRNEKD